MKIESIVRLEKQYENLSRMNDCTIIITEDYAYNRVILHAIENMSDSEEKKSPYIHLTYSEAEIIGQLLKDASNRVGFSNQLHPIEMKHFDVLNQEKTLNNES